MSLNGVQIKEMVSEAKVQELFTILLEEFHTIRDKNSYTDDHLAKLYIMKWRKIAGQDPSKMSEALKEYL